MGRLWKIGRGARGAAVVVAVLAMALGAFAASALAARPPLSLDRSFGNSGVASVGESIPGYHQAAAVEATADGSILVAGEGAGAGGSALVCFTPGGALDSSYGEGGSVPLSGVSGIDTMALDSGGGAAVLSGRTEVTRVTADGAIDTAFGDAGSVSLPALDPTFSSLHFWSLAILPDGDLLAAGIRFGSPRMVVVRLLPDGSLDRGFGHDGIAMLGSGKVPFAGAYAMAVENGGDVVLAGYAHHAPAVARLLPDGSPDRSFGKGGISDASGFVGQLTALSVRPDGSIIAAGHGGHRRGGGYENLLLRFRPGGALDRSFGSASPRFRQRGKLAEPLALLPSHGRYFLLIRTAGPALRAFRANGLEGPPLGGLAGVPPAHFNGSAATVAEGDLILAWTPDHPTGKDVVRLERFAVR